MALIKHYPDVLDCIANLSNDEVFTPPVLVNKVLDMLPLEVWSNPNLKWLDPSCKTGVFLREIAKRLWNGLEKIIPNESERKEHIFKKMIYGIAITELTALSSRRSLYYSKNPQSSYSIYQFSNTEGNIFYENIQHTFKGNECIYCGINNEIFQKRTVENNELHAYNFIHKQINDIFKGNNMKFDVIVGNPPYQINTSEDKPNAIPIYQLFIGKAKEMNPKYICMITPSRWFAGGSSKLDSFREEMKSDKRLRKIFDFSDASECFPGVEIKGGVNYFLWDRDYNGDCEFNSIEKGKIKSSVKRNLNAFDIIIRHNESLNILEKVNLIDNIFIEKNDSLIIDNSKTLNSVISSQTPYGFVSSFDSFSKKETLNSVKIYARNETGWVNKDLIKKNKDWVSFYQVLLGKAYGASEGFPHQILGQPINAGNNICCTQTYLVFGKFNSQLEADNYVSYIKTKFVRFLIALRKNTQDISPSTVAFVPKPDLSISYSDEYLYKRYNLNEPEIKLIESMIKPYD